MDRFDERKPVHETDHEHHHDEHDHPHHETVRRDEDGDPTREGDVLGLPGAKMQHVARLHVAREHVSHRTSARAHVTTIT